MRALVVVAVMALLGQPAQQPTPAAAPPSTDIYELSFDGTADGLKSAKLRPVATAKGYDNQPFFTPDGRAILFTANRDAKQTDIYEFDRGTGSIRQIVASPEGEYSPTITPDGTTFSVIRVEADGTQRLWRFDRNGTNPRIVLNDIKPVGYHAWIDAHRLALFVLGKPATLQLASVSSGKADILARDIGRSLQRIPGTQAVSFVQREADGEMWVKQLDGSTGQITPIVRIAPGSTERDCAWLLDGTLLMSAATRIFAYRVLKEARAGDSVAWREVFDATAHKLGAVTRISIAGDGKALAIVVNESAEQRK